MLSIKSRRCEGALTLIELMISLSMLSLLLLLIFATFEMGTRLFRDTSVRQGSEMELRGIKLMLERDVNLSNFWYSGINDSPREVSGEKRDALSLVTLNDWDDPANYDSNQRPAWNRYIVWYATLEPKGRLVRQAVDPPLGGSPFFKEPYGALSSNLRDNPLLNDYVVYSRALTDNLRAFQTESRFQNGTIRVRIRLQASGGKRPQSMENTEEHLEVSMTFQPKNSWPAI